MTQVCGSRLAKTPDYQLGDGGSTPSLPLQFSRCPKSEVYPFIDQHHYAHNHSIVTDFAFRLDMDGALSGACIFGWTAGHPKAMCVLEGHDDPYDYRELTRLVLLDKVPKNGESQFVGWCLRQLKKTTNLLAVLSFADPKFGHNGCIYRATNWLYTGLQESSGRNLIINGVEEHPRSVIRNYGTCSVSALRNLGLDVQTRKAEPKHRYVYLFNMAMLPLLKYPVLKFVAVLTLALLGVSKLWKLALAAGEPASTSGRDGHDE